MARGKYLSLEEARKQKHLQRYLNEFDFRYSYRKITDPERTIAALQGIEGKRLTYRRPRSWF